MKLTLSYNLTQELFTLELTDDAGVLSTANIPGMQPPEDDLFGESLALAMRSSPIAARIIIKSDTLREILIELESVGGAKVGTVSLNARSFDIAVVGDLSECLVSIPCQGDHVVSLECPSSSSSSSASYNFPLHSLLGSLRGLEIAEETCITINNNGMMAIQHQVIDPTTGDGTPSFVDFVRDNLVLLVVDVVVVQAAGDKHSLMCSIVLDYVLFRRNRRFHSRATRRGTKLSTIRGLAISIIGISWDIVERR